MTTFTVVSPGPFTTIQDAGRIGYHDIGLTEGGPMDYRSFAIANRLVGNDESASALEITFGGLTLKAKKPATIAITGAFVPLMINGKPKSIWRTQKVAAGDEVKLGFTGLGVRSYLAVAGGLNSTQWFNSSATVMRESLGSPLKRGDELATGSAAQVTNKLKFTDQPNLRKQATLRFVAGYQWSAVSEEQQQRFLNCEYQISARNDRMGYQLEGDTIDSGIEKIYSEGISKGTIQLPGNGQPIVLMNDRQTIGGYPKLGSVISPDLDKLAQLAAGSSIRFAPISPEQAIEEYRKYRHSIDSLSFA